MYQIHNIQKYGIEIISKEIKKRKKNNCSESITFPLGPTEKRIIYK